MEWVEGRERATSDVACVIREKAALGIVGAPIPRDAIETLTLVKLYNFDSDAHEVIHERANVAFIVDSNDAAGLPPWSYGVVEADDTVGTLRFTLEPADMPIADRRLGYERHVALFFVRHTGGEFFADLGIRVQNICEVA